LRTLNDVGGYRLYRTHKDLGCPESKAKFSHVLKLYYTL
jgi:hypothetical protein